MFAYWIGEHQQGSSVKVINFLRAHLLGGDKFSYQLDSCTSTRFRFNKEDFLPNRNAFAVVALLYFEKNDFTHFAPRNFPLYYFAYLCLLDTKSQLSGPTMLSKHHLSWIISIKHIAQTGKTHNFFKFCVFTVTPSKIKMQTNAIQKAQNLGNERR